MSIIDNGPFLNSLNTQSFNNLNNVSKGNNIDLYLMEKDKEIINLSNQNIALKNQIDLFQKT